MSDYFYQLSDEEQERYYNMALLLHEKGFFTDTPPNKLKVAIFERNKNAEGKTDRSREVNKIPR